MRQTRRTYFGAITVARYKFGPATDVLIGNPVVPQDVSVDFAEPPSSPEPGVCVAALMVAPHDGSLKAPVRAWVLIAPAPPQITDDPAAYLQQPYPQAVVAYPDGADPATGVRLDFRLDGLPEGRFYVVTVLEYID
jgi:hypothetical protein